MEHKIIDFHTHIGDVINGFDPEFIPDEKPFRFIIHLFSKIGFWSPFPGPTPPWMRIPLAVETQMRHSWGFKNRLLDCMSRYGITHSVVHPIEPMTPTENIFNECKENKNLLVTASVNPKDPKKIEKLKKYIALGCAGLKLHPILQHTSPEDKSYFEIIEEYQKYNKFVLFHTGEFDYYTTRTHFYQYGNVSLFEKIISAFPKVKFVLGHTGLHTPEPAIELAVKYKNVYLETSFQSAKSIRNIISKVDNLRILFGSDWPGSFQIYNIKIMTKAVRSNTELRDKIFYKNAQELLGISL